MKDPKLDNASHNTVRLARVSSLVTMSTGRTYIVNQDLGIHLQDNPSDAAFFGLAHDKIFEAYATDDMLRVGTSESSLINKRHIVAIDSKIYDVN